MNPIEFQKKWLANTRTETSASQEHFLDLCALVNHPNPADLDPTGEFFTFEKGASKLRGGEGWADVWRRGHFALEYKGLRKDLKAAYVQLAQYREDLENPPLLIVSDLNRIEIHTNFTGTVKHVHNITLATITEPESLRVLTAAFFDPDSLKPTQTVQGVTEAASRHFGALASGLRGRGADPREAAHFLMQLLFCLFAEDIGILPNKVFTKLLDFVAKYPARFEHHIENLLNAMANGGEFNMEIVPHVNGGLFSRVLVFELTPAEIAILAESARMDWSSIEPAIFGTLFERSLDPAKRAQLGAHYTGRRDIERVVDPVVMTPLRRKWETARAAMDTLRQQAEQAPTAQARRAIQAKLATTQGAFLQRLAAVKVLDPACGSGNFLYVALERLLALEKEAIKHGAEAGLSTRMPEVGPGQLLGMEIDPLARELAQVAIWIGYLQWMIANGFGWKEPVLEPLETIRLQDALIIEVSPAPDRLTVIPPGGASRPEESLAAATQPRFTETPWPKADYIIGNPPFLGRKELRKGLGDTYVDTLFDVYRGKVTRTSNLCCYFFEQARYQIQSGRAQRAGLLATENIRMQDSRAVLARIKESGDIFMAWSDEPWILDGASVRISIIGIDDGSDTERELNGQPVGSISSDLTSGLDVTIAKRLGENFGISYMGLTLSGPFDIPGDQAVALLNAPTNVNGRPNSDVIKRFYIGKDVTDRPRNEWVIDFGTMMTEEEASHYEAPYEYALRVVKPARMKSKSTTGIWWRHERPRSDMRDSISSLSRFLATVLVSKHHLFVWVPKHVAPANRLIVFARDDDYFFGVLQSRAHEVWALRMGARHGGERPTYNNSVCFETFPLPWPPGSEPANDPRVIAIGVAAARLDELRRNWLDPKGATEVELKKRTLTNLYNRRPAWLQHAHAELDRAVWAAYGWDDPVPAEVDEDTILSRLLALNLERTKEERT